MKTSLSILLFLLLASVIKSQDIQYTIYRTTKVPVIDGFRDSVWQEVPAIKDFFAIKEKTFETDPDDSLDCGPSFQLLWDDSSLYVYMEVYDDLLHKDAIGLGIEKSIGYNDDCFEIFIDGDYSHGENWDGKNDCELWFLWEEREVLTYKAELIPFSTEHIIYAQKNMEGEGEDLIGWSAEVRFPLSDIEIPSVDGAIFGLDLKYSDDDGNEVNPNLEGTDREHNMRWCGAIDFHPPSTWFAVQLSDSVIGQEITTLPERITNKRQVKVYPNPMADHLIILLPDPQEESVNFRLYNQLGQKVMHQEIKNPGDNGLSIDLETYGLRKGIYFYQLQTENRMSRGKLIHP